MAKRIGLVPMSAKPYHAGHDGLVRIAASQCDVVHLFVSLSDRVRPGELPILGNAMKVLWEKYIEPSLPSNVVVTYGGSPVGNLYSMLGEADKNRSGDTYVIYSDAEDILKYTDKSLSTYAPFLFKKNQIELEGIDRSQTVDVSGTKMRAALASGDVKRFSKNLPTALRPHATEIIKLLSNTGSANVPKSGKRKKSLRSENAIREYVKLILEYETVSGIAGAESPFGVAIAGDAGELFNIFVAPFVDAYKVGVAEIKQLTTRTRTLLKVAVGTILSTFIPGCGKRYAKVFEQENKELEAIKNEYKDVYANVDRAFTNGDAAMFAFMASPATVLGYKGGRAALNIGRREGTRLLSAVTGGYSDELFSVLEKKSKGFGRWLIQGTEFGKKDDEEDKSKKKKGSPDKGGPKDMFDGYVPVNSLLKEAADEAREKKYEEAYRKVVEKALESPAAKKMQEDAKKVYKKTLEELYGQAEAVLRKSTRIEDLEKFLGKEMDVKTRQSIEEIKKLPPKEKVEAEKSLIEGIRGGTKDFYVRSMEDHVKLVLATGIPEESEYVKDYRETINKIKAL